MFPNGVTNVSVMVSAEAVGTGDVGVDVLESAAEVEDVVDRSHCRQIRESVAAVTLSTVNSVLVKPNRLVTASLVSMLPISVAPVPVPS